MFTISNDNIITLNRGDSAKTPLFINAGDEFSPVRYYLKDNDELYLGIMEPNQSFECAIIKKKFTSKDFNKNGDVIIKIEPDDTVCLIPGKYFYQVKAKILNEDGTYDVNTVIEKTEFIIQE